MPITQSGVPYLIATLSEMDELLEVREVADLTRTSERTVRRWLASGKLAGLKRSSKGYLIPQEALIDFLDPAKAKEE